MIAAVYLHRNPLNTNIFYVGFTSNNKGKRPYTVSNRNTYWTNTFKKYGREVEIVSTGNIKDMLELEEFIIQEIGISNLTNVETGGIAGGIGIPMSEKTKYKISKALKGRKGKRGYKLSEEHKEKIRLGNIGNKPSEYCKKLANEAKRKSISQYTLAGSFIKKWDSINEASKKLGLNRLTIRWICTGKTKKPRHFIFKYNN